MNLFKKFVQECACLEEYEKEWKEVGAKVQYLHKIQVDAEKEEKRLEELNQFLSSWHIELEAFGSDTLVVRKVPVWMKEIDGEGFLQDCIDLFLNDRSMSWTSRVVRTLASKNRAWKERSLSLEECRQQIAHLQQCRNPVTTFNGDSIFVLIEEKALLKEFKK